MARAALSMARIEYPDLDLDSEVRRLDELARQLAPRVGVEQGVAGRLAALRSFLVEDCGFRGNQQDYYDPRNSFLNDVLTRRTGLPITLAVVYIEIGRRVGVPLFGVGLPGHFLVKYEDARQTILLDPFHEGRALTPAGCREILDRMYEGKMEFRSEYLAAVDKRHILLRMLSNLRAIYLERREFKRALGVVDLILSLTPDSGEDLKQRGLLHWQLQNFPQARRDLESYLFLNPGAADAEEIRGNLRELKSFSAMLN